MSTTPAPSPLAIHLDLNKTILLSDVAGGKSLDDVVSDLIASTAWGVVTSLNDGQPLWTLASEVLSVDPPALGDLLEEARQRLATYSHFAKHILYPYTKTSTSAAAAAENRAKKSNINILVHSFTQPGQPGFSFRDIHLDVCKAISLSAAERVAVAAFGGAPFLDTVRHLLPCYFRLLEHLVESGRPWAIFLRTFGSDLANVIAEHNLFVAGRHPLYPASAAILEAGLEIRCPEDTLSVARLADGSAVLSEVDPRTNAVATRVGVPAIHGALQQRRGVFAVQDDYDAWWRNHERSAYGKIFPFNVGDPAIFIDDNIGAPSDAVRLLAGALTPAMVGRVTPTSACTSNAASPAADARIVAAVDAGSGDAIPLSLIRNVHCVRADTLSCVLNAAYLIQLLTLCESNQRGST